jgi:dolichyl-phosphate-mannose--protein O-mannosyl transferase
VTASDNSDGEILKSLNLPFKITIFMLLLAVILGVATFTRFYRLGEPDQCYFDEVYFPTTGALILHGDDAARNFFGSENTHPPLSKLFMAAGQGIFGTTGNTEANECWGDAEDESKRTDADWLYKPFGWRIFGALFGVGSVLFVYLIAKRLFHSEIAGLAAAFILTFEGLALVQSRIATPDTFVLFFMLGTVYFLISHRFLLSGVFLGAAFASKWNVGFIFGPIVLYFAWRLWQGIRETERQDRLRGPETTMLAGLGIFALGGALLLAFGRDEFVLAVFDAMKAVVLLDFSDGAFEDLLPAGPVLAAGVAVLLAGVLAIALDPARRSTPRGKVYLEVAAVFPVFFIMVPLYTYALTYVPWLLDGGSVVEAIDQNRSAYDFHSSLTAEHGWSSSFWEWPIMGRPIFIFAGENEAKIYSMGNPFVFWLGLPALAFVLMQGLRSVRARLNDETGWIQVSGGIGPGQAALLFVVVGFLGMWLPWALNPRTLFLYHYLPAVGFMVLAMAYCVHWLWHNNVNWELTVGGVATAAAVILNRLGSTGTVPDVVEFGVLGVGVFGITAMVVGVVKLVQGVESPSPWPNMHWGQVFALLSLTLIAGTFIYFYPHMTAIDVPRGVSDSYFWFNSWR